MSIVNYLTSFPYVDRLAGCRANRICPVRDGTAKEVVHTFAIINCQLSIINCNNARGRRRGGLHKIVELNGKVARLADVVDRLVEEVRG